MKKITQLIKSLSASEVKLVRKYYSISPKLEYNLKIKLFDIALKNPGISDDEAAKALGKKNNAAFSMLKTRLRDDILKVIIVEGKDKIFQSAYFRARHQVHYLLLEMDILSDRLLRDQAIETILKAKRIATKYELINDLIVINDIILNGFAIQLGPSKFNKNRQTGIEVLKKADDLFWATDYFKQTTLPNLYEANKSLTKLESIKSAVDKLGSLTETSDIARLQYFYLRSKANYYKKIGDFITTKQTSEEFLNLIKNNNVLKSSDSMGGGHLMVSDACLHLKEYDNAIQYASIGLEYFYKNTPNHINMVELIFQGNFYKKSYDNAMESVKIIKGLSIVKPGTFQYDKWLYFSANVEFMQGDYKSVLKTLKRHSFIKTDKSGWRLGFRILELMALVELEQYDNLPYRLDTFRKMLSSITEADVTRPRAVWVLMNRLVKESFDFRAVDKKQKEEIGLLRAGEGNYFWDPRGYEIIRFDEWWAGKVKKK